MSRTRRPISRTLIGLLALVLGLGIFFWVHNLTKSDASPSADATGKPKLSSELKAQELAKAAEPKAAAKPEALVTQTPTAAPSPAVVTNVVASTNAPAAAATRPAGAAVPKPLVTATSTQPLVDGKAKLDAGKHLEARQILNAALKSGKLSPADAASVKALLNQVNEVLVFSSKRFADDEFGGVYTVQPGNRLQSIAAQHDITWELLARINGLSDPRKMRAGQALKLVKGPFHAVVDKSDFTIELYLGGTPGESTSVYVTSFKVGLGADDSTPTGTWIVKNKLKNPAYFSPRGEGVIEADDPANPLGEFWLSLEGLDGHAVGKESYGIHGTIEPESIGKMASMGCIRLLNEDVAKIYELLVSEKSTVVVQE